MCLFLSPTETSGYIVGPDFNAAALRLLIEFRKGRFGKINLDIGVIEDLKSLQASSDDLIERALQQRAKEDILTE